MTQAIAHRWRFFRAGGFDQVQLETPADLAALRSLDQKLWASLACPVNNLELDRRMLQYIDLNADGRIRAPEILDVVDWTLARLRDPDVLFQDGPLHLSSLTDDAVGARLPGRECAAVGGRAPGAPAAPGRPVPGRPAAPAPVARRCRGGPPAPAGPTPAGGARPARWRQPAARRSR